MTIHDSKGKFTKAATGPFKVGDRVEKAHKGVYMSPFCDTVPIGAVGTIAGHHCGEWWVVVWDSYPYPPTLQNDHNRIGEIYIPEELRKLDDAPAAPEVVATRYRDELHRTESELREATAELREATAERDRLNADLDLQKRIAEAALFREKAEARRAVAAESKLSDIAALRRAMEIMGSIRQEGGVSFSDAIDAVLARK